MKKSQRQQGIEKRTVAWWLILPMRPQASYSTSLVLYFLTCYVTILIFTLLGDWELNGITSMKCSSYCRHWRIVPLFLLSILSISFLDNLSFWLQEPNEGGDHSCLQNVFAICYIQMLALPPYLSWHWATSLPGLSNLGHTPDGSVPLRTGFSWPFSSLTKWPVAWPYLYACYRSVALALGPSWCSM